MNDIYEIRTVKDFLKVPASKREAMLADFNGWLEMTSMVDLLFRPEILTSGDSFKWVDDGVSGISGFNIRRKEQPE